MEPHYHKNLVSLFMPISSCKGRVHKHPLLHYLQIDVLKEIGCIDADLVVQIKGRVACEMNSGEELICTECLFENQLDDLEPEEAVAIMSSFVFQQKETSESFLTPKLSQAKKRLFSSQIFGVICSC